MSDTIGSAFGRGGFGRGPYSRDGRETPAAIVAASRVQAAGVIIIQPTLAAMEATAAMIAAGQLLWQTISVECAPWTAIGGGVSGLPNSAGGMFP